MVASISGSEASVHYTYEEAELPGIGVIPGMSRLVAASVHDAAGAQVSTRRYHYEDPSDPCFNPGSTLSSLPLGIPARK